MDHSSRWRDLYALARPRGGVTVLDDARRVGIADRTYQARWRREAWVDLGGGAHLLPGAPDTPLARRHAALLVLGPEAVLSHGTALTIHDLSRWGAPEGRVHATLPYVATTTPPHRTRRHRSRRLEPEDVTNVDGLPVTTAARTLLDVAAQFGRYRLEGMMLQARQRRLLEADDLHRQLSRRPTLRGAARFRVALGVMDGSSVDSILEHRALALIRSHGLPEPIPQYRVHQDGRTVHVDFAWPAAGAALECDGRSFHGDEAFQRDRDRWNLISRAGLELVWATWYDVHERPLHVVSRLRRALAV